MASNALAIASQVIVMAIIVSVVLLFAGIGVLVLIRVFIIGRTLRNGGGIVVERGVFGSTSMSREDIEKLPCFDFVGEGKGRKTVSEDCAVCLEEFRAGEKCRLLPLCKHSFHAECVDSWLLRARICPICRTSADPAKRVSISGLGSGRFGDDGDIESTENSAAWNDHEAAAAAATSGEERDLDVNRISGIRDSKEEDLQLQGNRTRKSGGDDDQRRITDTVVVRIED